MQCTMLFKSCSWILILTVNAYALVIEDLINRESLAKLPNEDYTVYNFDTDDTLDIVCRREDGLESSLGWVLGSPQSGDSDECEKYNEKSIRYRVILTAIDHNRNINCFSTTSGGPTEKFQIVLNFTGLIVEEGDDPAEGRCDLPTQVYCPELLNKLFMNISVNGKILSPTYESYLPAYEFVYNYNKPGDIEISCLSHTNPTSHVLMCANALIEQQLSCKNKTFCECKQVITLNKETNNTLVYCYTSNEIEPLAALRLIAQDYDAPKDTTTTDLPEEYTTETSTSIPQDVTDETSTSRPEVVTDKPSTSRPKVVTDKPSTPGPDVVTVKPPTEDDDDLDIVNYKEPPVFEVSTRDFFIIAGLTAVVIAIAVIYLIYTICNKMVTATKSDISLLPIQNERASNESINDSVIQNGDGNQDTRV